MIEDRAERDRRGPGGSTRASRLLGLLSLFTLDTPLLTVDTIASRLHMATATVYRYIRELSDAGFLIPAAGGGYVLGPRFIEIDRQIRIADPLLRIGPQIMKALRDREIGAQLLCSFYGTRVLCIHQQQRDARITMSMERGRPFPLFIGAPSRIILANLPVYHLKSLFLNHSQEIRRVGLGDDWKAFNAKLRTIRRAGYYVGSEIDATLVGVAAPVFRAPGKVIASLCMVRLRSEVGERELQRMIAHAQAGAARITAALQATGPSKIVPSYAAARRKEASD
jgi:DNA-binding IclR family transcriptional regulator